MMQHADLAGLAYQSEAIVVAERGAVRQVTQYQSVTSYRVTRVLFGTLPVGATLTLDDSSYALNGTPYGASYPQPLDAGVVLFLAHVQPDTRQPPEWSIVLSGLRVMAGGKVYRFEQWSNPGPFVPVPQAHDPDDARGEVPNPLAVDQPAFETMLRAAIARATALRQALALTDPVARRARVVALLGPAADPFAAGVRPGNFYEDILAERAATALAAAGDVDAALDARARGRAGHNWPDVDGSVLVARAADGAAPVPVRTAALDLLRMADFTAADEHTVASVAQSAAQPEVRAAALQFLGGLSGRMDEGGRAAVNRRRGLTRTTIDAVRAHETDPRVVTVANTTAQQWGFSSGRIARRPR